VADDLADSFPATLELSFAALLISIVLGVPAGVWSAVSRGRLPDYVVRVLSLAGGSLPVFWLGLIVIGLFYYQLGWFPGGGRLDTFVPPPPTRTGLYVLDSILAGDVEALRSSLVHLVLPALTLGYFSTAVIARMTRSSMLDVLGQDYMRTARAKGLREPVIVLRHALRNALIPTITIVGLTFGSLLSGAVLTETIFSWPGLGRYATASAVSLDFPAVLGVTLLAAVVYPVANLVGVVVVALAGVFGTFVGLVAGYAGGLADEALMRFTEVFLAFPPLILAMAIAGALGPSLTNAIIAIAAVTWAVYARLARGQLLS